MSTTMSGTEATASRLTEADLLTRVADVAPTIREHQQWQEANRRMAQEVFECLSGAGFFAMFKPSELGGLECEPLTGLRVFEEITRIDPSVGWAVANQVGIDTIVGAVLAGDAAAEIFADPNRPVSAGWAPPGTAILTDGGYRVTGQWPFGSTCSYAQAFTALALVQEGDGLRTGPDGNPVMLVVFVPSADVEILDTWYTMGMRGTGSSDFAMRDVFVPERRTWLIAPSDGPTSGPCSGVLYRLFPWLPISTLAPVGIGIAAASLDALAELAVTKTPSYTTRSLRDHDLVQATMGRGHAMVSAARAYLHSAIDGVQSARLSGRKPTLAEGLEVQLATSLGLETGTRVTEMVQNVVGTSGIRLEYRFQQLFRDAFTIGQHAFGAQARYESVGQILLGLTSDWGFFYL
jgi:alkylation response protein AidB-like acyl-CoA dehydrogenase